MKFTTSSLQIDGEHLIVFYAKWLLSQKPYLSTEKYIAEHIHPYYANVHSESVFLVEQSEFFRKEAKAIVRRYFNADERDSVIFHGQGATSCINKLLRPIKSSWEGWAISTSQATK